VPASSPWKSSSPALRRLVREHLLERSEGLPPASLAAFVAGWGSALQLLRRGHAELPWVSPQEQRWIGELLDAIEEASQAELDDE
jgi:hypothetical protein